MVAFIQRLINTCYLESNEHLSKICASVNMIIMFCFVFYCRASLISNLKYQTCLIFMIPRFNASDGKHHQPDVVHLYSMQLLQDTIRLASQDFTNILFLLSPVFHVFRHDGSQLTTLIVFHVYLSFAFLPKSRLIMRASVRDLCLRNCNCKRQTCGPLFKSSSVCIWRIRQLKKIHLRSPGLFLNQLGFIPV